MIDAEFTDEAFLDIQDAYNWYENERLGLGELFLYQIEERLSRLKEYPESSPTEVDEFRRAMLKQFPYYIVYEFNPKLIVVYAVIHTSRDPKHWIKRTN